MQSNSKENLAILLKTQNTKIWFVFWNKFFKKGNLGNMYFCALQYSAEIFGVLTTESADALLAL